MDDAADTVADESTGGEWSTLKELADFEFVAETVDEKYSGPETDFFLHEQQQVAC